MHHHQPPRWAAACRRCSGEDPLRSSSFRGSWNPFGQTPRRCCVGESNVMQLNVCVCLCSRVFSSVSFKFPWWKAPELECAEAVCADDYNTDEYTVGLGCGRWSQPRLGPSDMSMETDWFC
ncbi:unnamed protein product [Boreogadus saida]